MFGKKGEDKENHNSKMKCEIALQEHLQMQFHAISWPESWIAKA